MKLASALLAASAFLLLDAAWLPNAAAAEQAMPAKPAEAAYECKSNKAKVPTCKRPVSQEARKQCTWRCTIPHCRPDGSCIEVCRGSGPECNGKTPGAPLPL